MSSNHNPLYFYHQLHLRKFKSTIVYNMCSLFSFLFVDFVEERIENFGDQQINKRKRTSHNQDIMVHFFLTKKRKS